MVTSAMKCPRMGFGVPSCEIQVWAVGDEGARFGVPGLSEFMGGRASDTSSGGLCLPEPQGQSLQSSSSCHS